MNSYMITYYTTEDYYLLTQPLRYIKLTLAGRIAENSTWLLIKEIKDVW